MNRSFVLVLMGDWEAIDRYTETDGDRSRQTRLGRSRER